MKQITIETPTKTKILFVSDKIEYQTEGTIDGEDVYLGYYTKEISKIYGVLDVITDKIGFIGKVNITVKNV